MGVVSRAALAALVITFLGAGCAERTQIMVGIATNMQLSKLQLQAGPGVDNFSFDKEWSFGTSSGQLNQATDMPATFGFVPRDRTDASIVIQVTGTDANGVAVTRRARVSYVEGKVLFLRIFLDALCARDTCTKEQSCVVRDGKPRCESIDIEAQELPPYTTDKAKQAECGDAKKAMEYGLTPPPAGQENCAAGRICVDFICVPGTAIPDMTVDQAPAASDGGVADQSAPRDLVPPPDLVAPPDMVVVRDMTVPPDMTVLPDLVVPPDMTVLPDLTPPRDMTVLPDLTVQDLVGFLPDLRPPPPDLVRVPDLTVLPDLATSDLAMPDLKPAPDLLSSSDMGVLVLEDMSVPPPLEDMSMESDMTEEDMHIPDLGEGDMATGDDLAVEEDMAVDEDMAVGEDMAAGEDMAMEEDMAAEEDMASDEDMSMSFDFSFTQPGFDMSMSFDFPTGFPDLSQSLDLVRSDGPKTGTGGGL